MSSMGLVQCQMVPRSRLYLFSRSKVAPQMHSLSINCRVLLCYTCHFQSIFPSLFCFLCLQVSSVSNFPSHKGAKEATYSGSLVPLCCEEGGALQTNTAGVCGECLQWMDNPGLARAHGGVTSGSTLLRLQGAVHGALSPAGAACRSLPRSKPPRFPGPPQGHRPRWTVCFVPFPGARRVHYPRWAMRLMHLPSPGLSVS